MSLRLLKTKGNTEGREIGALETTMRRINLLTGVTGIRENQREGTRSYVGLQETQEHCTDTRGV